MSTKISDYLNREAYSTVLSGEWSVYGGEFKNGWKEGELTYISFFNFTLQGNEYRSSPQIPDINLRYRYKWVSLSDRTEQNKIQTVFAKLGIGSFFVAIEEEEIKTRWESIYITEQVYTELVKNNISKNSQLSIHELEKELEKKLPAGKVVYLGDEGCPTNWLDTFYRIRERNLVGDGIDFSEAWNVPEKKELILELAAEYNLI